MSFTLSITDARQIARSGDPSKASALAMAYEERTAKIDKILDASAGRAFKADEQREYDQANEELAELRQLVVFAREGITVEEAERRAAREIIESVYGPSALRSESVDPLGQRLHDAVGEVLVEGRQSATVELRTVTEGGAGGYGVPLQMMGPVETLLPASVVMNLPGLRTDQATSDRVRYPRLGSATVSAVAEAATLTAASSDIDAVDVPMVKYGALDYLSSELVEDFSANALAAFGSNLLRNLAAAVDNGLLEGLGGTDAVGIRNVPGVNSTSQAGLPTDFVKFRTAEYELRVDNANPVVWVCHPRTWNILANIKTGLTSDVTTLIAPDPREASGASLLGYPVAMSSQITLTEGAGAGSWAALLDTSQLILVERRPPTFEVSREFAFDTDRVAVRCTWRGGLAVLNPEAISLVTDIRAS